MDRPDNKRNFVSRYHIKSTKKGRAVKILALEYIGGTLQAVKFTQRFIGYPDKLMLVLCKIPASDAIWRARSQPVKANGNYQHINNFADMEHLYVHRCKVLQAQPLSQKLMLWLNYFKHFKGFDYKLELKDKEKIEACKFVAKDYLTVYFKAHKADHWEFRACSISNFVSKQNAIRGFVAKEQEKLNNPHGFKPEPTAHEYFKIKTGAEKTAYLAYYKKQGWSVSYAADGAGGTIPKWTKEKPVHKITPVPKTNTPRKLDPVRDLVKEVNSKLELVN